MNEDSEKKEFSFDLVGLGKVAKSIPKEVYINSTNAIIESFNKIISPIAETTTGLGRYIKQKFDNMVETEKAIGAFTLQNAIEKAREKGGILTPQHLKSFISSFEEASKETDPILHEMWENIISNQLSDSEFHPRYVKVLSNFSAEEANLLLMLNTINKVGDGYSGYFGSPRDVFHHFVTKNRDKNLHKWSYSCNVLLELELAEVIAPHKGIYDPSDGVTILYKTKSGSRFLNTVTNK